VPPQNVFNEMSYGGPMLWWLYPRFKPFIDGRGDAYTVEFWETKYLPALRAESQWPAIFREYDVHAVLLPIRAPGEIPKLAQTLFADPRWALVAYNDDSLFFLERTPTNAGVIARGEYRLIWPGDWSLSALASDEERVRAADEILRAAALAPDSVFVRTAMARVCLATERYAQAVELLAALTRVPGASANHWRDYGYALYCTRNFAEARRVFARMIRNRMQPGFAAYMNHYLALEEFDVAAARDWLARALALEPGNPAYLSARTNLESVACRR
jgi:tetratricopeptide (TPR) repeat protein